jgi:hypothetical protein
MSFSFLSSLSRTKQIRLMIVFFRICCSISRTSIKTFVVYFRSILIQRKLMQQQTSRWWPRLFSMLFLFSRISTWLFVEIIATLILAVLNMIIPILMMFTSYRNLANFYLSSAALSSSLINYLYFFYLIQTIRSKILSENNCRAFYYLQTSCIVVLGMNSKKFSRGYSIMRDNQYLKVKLNSFRFIVMRNHLISF